MVAVKYSFLSLVAVIAALLTIQMTLTVLLLNSSDSSDTNIRSHTLNDLEHRYGSFLSMLMLPASLVVRSLFPKPLGNFSAYASRYVNNQQLRTFGAIKHLRSSLLKSLQIIAINFKHFSFSCPFNATVQWDNNVSTDGLQDSKMLNRCRNLTNAVVIYQSCTPHTFSWVSYHNIYEYYDSVITCGKALSSAFPDNIIAWQAPPVVFVQRCVRSSIENSSCDNELMQDDLRALHKYLIDRHVKSCGILVVTPTVRHADWYGHNPFYHFGLSTSTQHQELQYGTIMKDLVQEILRLSTTLASVEHYGRRVDDVQWYTSILNTIKMDQQHLMSRSNKYDLSTQCSKYLFTRKYHPQCHPPSSMVKAILVTGLGGCGTHFVANHLRRLGWRLYHEGIDDDGAVVRSAMLVLAIGLIVTPDGDTCMVLTMSTELVLLGQRPHAEHDVSLRKAGRPQSERLVSAI